MPRTPKNSWYMAGCKGRFYCRSAKKNPVIYYETGDRPVSLRLAYSAENKQIAARVIREREHPTIFRPDDPNAPDTISAAYELFMSHNYKRKSPGTWDNYLVAMRSFIRKEMTLQEIDQIKQHIEQNIRNSTCSKSTVNNRVTLIKAFFNYCIKQNWINENPLRNFEKFKVPRKVIEVYKPEEIEAILEHWYWKHPEFWLFLKFLYKTAFRFKEAFNLQWDQCVQGSTFRRSIIIPKSKYGSKPETFPLSGVIEDILRETTNYKNRSGQVFHLDKSYYNLLLNLKYSLYQLDINKRIPGTQKYEKNLGFHTFRKTRITEWIVKDKLTPFQIVKLSRDRIETVMEYYAQLDIEDYRDLVK